MLSSLCEFKRPLIVWSRITEQPYKIPFYAALLYYLSIPTVDGDTGTGEERVVKAPLGRLILDDFWKGFQAYLDKLAWRETRLCVRIVILLSFT
jgi:nuclear cap-binding protein subunit 1